MRTSRHPVAPVPGTHADHPPHRLRHRRRLRRRGEGRVAQLLRRAFRSSTSRTTLLRTTSKRRDSRSRATGGGSRLARCTSSWSIPASDLRRAAIAVSSDGRFLVGPDNGVLSPALLLPGAQVVALPVPADAAPTFHGRDVFAPAAAALASGASPRVVRRAARVAAVIRRTPEVVREPDGCASRRGHRHRPVRQRRHEHRRRITAATFALVTMRSRSAGPTRRRRGETVAVVGSSGLLEIAVRDGSAAELHGISRGTPVYARHDRETDGRQP